MQHASASAEAAGSHSTPSQAGWSLSGLKADPETQQQPGVTPGPAISVLVSTLPAGDSHRC